MMEAAPTSETSVDIQLRTRQYIPEDSELHTCRPENLKSHNLSVVLLGGTTNNLSIVLLGGATSNLSIVLLGGATSNLSIVLLGGTTDH
jgi:hypothetical protein